MASITSNSIQVSLKGSTKGITNAVFNVSKHPVEAIVVGTGLAGLTTTLQLLQAGRQVTLLEKMDKLGGNSIKASSGINGVDLEEDSVDAFVSDTLKSGKGLCNESLVKILAHNSRNAIDWLVEKDIDLSVISQLGGHSYPRTHRGGGNLPPGFSIVSTLIKKIQKYADDPNGQLTILKKASLKGILLESPQKVKGIEFLLDGMEKTLFGKNIILATGGFCADFKSNSLISKYRPDLEDLASTNGEQTTGDGQIIAERDTDANLILMDQIQVHPTGFIELAGMQQNSRHKFLCGELIRGIGGILLSPNTGKRFINELSTRDNVTQGINESCKISDNNLLEINGSPSVAILTVSNEDYLKAKNHIDFYVSKNLMLKGGLEDLAAVIRKLIPDSTINISDLKMALEEYNSSMDSSDIYGRNFFGSKFKTNESFYFGLVTPVLHFSMGGIEINENGQVVNKDHDIIHNFFAVGEVSGGVHGGNRLGGSSLLECVVFGTVVSKNIIQSLLD